MDYGDILKRSWRITWRYKALWVLGIFAGVSGCQGSSGSSGNSGSSFDTGTGAGDPFSGFDFGDIERFLVAILAVGFVLFIVGIVWWVLSLAAKPALVHAVNEIESGREAPLGQAWSVGWSHWGGVFVLRLLLGLPAFIIGVVFLIAILTPIVGPLLSGGEPGPEVLGPICGSLVCGLPLILIISIAVDLIYLVALRYVVLGGHGAIDSIKLGWKTIRVRFKDHALMYLINGALNIGASLVLAIPIVIITIVAVVPVVVSIGDGGGELPWPTIIAAVAAASILGIIVSILYTGIWGTYTSALWTIFFRKTTGMEPPVAAPVFAPAGGYAPPPPVYPGSAPAYPGAPETPANPPVGPLV